MQELLNKAKWTGPTANQPTEHATQNPHGANHIEPKIILAVFQGDSNAGHQLLE